jgi:hypothetical protein
MAERVTEVMPEVNPAAIASGSPIGMALAGRLLPTVGSAGTVLPPHHYAAVSMALRQVLGERDVRRRLHGETLAAREKLPRRMAAAVKQALLAHRMP